MFIFRLYVDILFNTCNYTMQLSMAGSGNTHKDKDWYALRFAETLLLRVEAYLAQYQEFKR